MEYQLKNGFSIMTKSAPVLIASPDAGGIRISLATLVQEKRSKREEFEQGQSRRGSGFVFLRICRVVVRFEKKS
jgi:hypothetical protein